MRRVKVIYILGSPRSGSSLLASLLGELPGFFAAAEMRLIWHGIDDRRCGCGRPVRDCPVWAPALAAAAHSGLRDEHDVLRVQDSTVRTCDLWRLLPRRGSGSPNVRAYRRMQGEMYNALAEISDARVVVDSSKNPAEATLLRDAIDADATVVHLVRDPRAVSYSWQRAARTGRAPRQRSVTETALRWMVTNTAAELVGRAYEGRRAFVRYEDLVAGPHETLVRLASLVGESASDLGFLDDPSRARSSRHMVGGNALRFERGVVRLRPDTQWLHGLPRAQSASVTAITLPLLLRYRYPPLPSLSRGD